MADNQAFEDERRGSTPSVSGSQGFGDFDSAADRVHSLEMLGPYAGMPKEVLLKYSRQKHFVWARNILTAAVILTILALLSMIIALIAVSPACQKFYQTSPIYQIYPKSFKDSDNDGIGDLQGIKDVLSYVRDDLGVSTIWLNPIYPSPQVDNGYDIQDYKNIDEIFGTMADFDELISEMHDNNMKLVMDFVPNHTSNKHKWFLASSNPDDLDYEKYKDYYVWVNSTDGTRNGIPNNWQSVFSDVETSAWEWNEKRKQFYYHAFYKEQPDLNLRNKDVLQELEDILAFWMDHGVDGFRCDALKFMFEAEHLRSNPVIDGTELSYENVYNDYTENQPGIHDIVASWRILLRKYSTEPGVYRFMETEVYDDNLDVIIRYYGTPWQDEADFPMNFQFIDLGNDSASWTGTKLEATVLNWMRKMPSNKWPNWVLGNHDNSRLVTRLGAKRSRCATFLSLTLSGTPGIYYGEEIGMTDYNMNSPEDFRDPYRTPMQWNVDSNSGFCSNCTPWLPVNPNFNDSLNVESQLSTDRPESVLKLYKQLISLRSDVTFSRGWLCMIHSTKDSIVFVREMSGTNSYLIAINFNEDSTTSETLNLKGKFDESLPESGDLVLSINNNKQNNVPFNPLVLKGGDGIVVRFKPGAAKDFFNRRANMQDRCFNPRKVCVNVIGLLEVC